MSNIPFIDLQAQRKRLEKEINTAIQRVLDQGSFIMGPEIRELESQLSVFCGAKHAITCSNGTDALALILMAKGIKAGDAIFVPTFTFAATAEVVAWLGATPVFVDILPDAFNMDPESLRIAIGMAKQKGLKPKAIITVDMFGQPADYDPIEKIAQDNNLWILSDAAQSFGASYKGKKVGTIGLATSTSFFPAKPLGCYGDGGAIFTDDDHLARLICSLRLHGQGSHKYDYIHIGMNGRMDTLQAAILLPKLAIFPEELEARDKVAQRYSEALADLAVVPKVMEGCSSTWAQYTLILKMGERSKIMDKLNKAGIPTGIYYPKPLHLQPAYQQFHVGGALPVSEMLSDLVLSLPMHAYLDEKTQEIIIKALRSAILETAERSMEVA